MKYYIAYPIILLYKFFSRLCNNIENSFWNYYCKSYLVFFKASLNDPQTIIFKGKCVLQIKKGAKISIGRKMKVNSGNTVGIDSGTSSKIVVYSGAELIIGNNSGMSNTVIQCRNYIEIGNYVNIGAGCLIMDNNFHSTDWQVRMLGGDGEKAACAPIKIGDNVFVGAHCIIMKGVSIGEKSIIAAGSVVVKNIPPKQIWGGNPAKFIKNI